RLPRKRPERAHRQAAGGRAHRARVSAAARDDAGPRRLVRGGDVRRLPRQRVGGRRGPRPHDLERPAPRHQAERDGSLGRDLQRGAGGSVRRAGRLPVGGGSRRLGALRRFVSGDPRAVTQLQQVAPSAEGAIVKEPYGYHSALTVTPARGQAMSREAANRARAKLGSLQPYRITGAIGLEVGFKLTIDAERAAFVPGLSRSDAHNVKGTFKDMIEISKLLQVVSSLDAP